jgi:hypothetical protein
VMDTDGSAPGLGAWGAPLHPCAGGTTRPITRCVNAYEQGMLEGLGVGAETCDSPLPPGSGRGHQRASCYQKAGDLSRAVNLYQAALAGPHFPLTTRCSSQ